MSTPRWFQEGFADWAAGGTTCEGEWRLWIELGRQGEAGQQAPHLNDLWSVVPERLAYDFSTAFFEYLESSKPGFLSGGELLASVKGLGVHGALSLAYGVGILSPEGEWFSIWRSALATNRGVVRRRALGSRARRSEKRRLKSIAVKDETCDTFCSCWKALSAEPTLEEPGLFFSVAAKPR